MNAAELMAGSDHPASGTGAQIVECRPPRSVNTCKAEEIDGVT